MIHPAEQLFGRVAAIVDAPDAANAGRQLHETLALCCDEALKNTSGAFGNLFSKVSALCRQHHIGPADTAAIQKMRRDGNRSDTLLPEDVLYDCRALAIFISAVFDADVPSSLTGRIPAVGKPVDYHHIDYKYIRCIVEKTDGTTFTAHTDSGGSRTIEADISDASLSYLVKILRPGMQLNLLDCTTEDTRLVPGLVIVEPDYLLDISSIAACFEDYGHHPLTLLVRRMTPAANSQAILVGNFAGSALDDIINATAPYHWQDTFKGSFKERTLEYCTCPDLQPTQFRQDILTQTENISAAVKQIADDAAAASQADRGTADLILEPTFVCEQLGVQGRVDLMTTDFRLLVEQKAGKNYNLQTRRPGRHGFQIEKHYVQLLLYYGVLRYNFGLARNHTDCKLLYSRYPMPLTLLSVNFYRDLFREAIRFRNQAVATDLLVAREGFGRILPLLQPDTFNVTHACDRFFQQYRYPQIAAVTAPIHRLSPVEQAYFCAMATFVIREQAVAKMGAREGLGNSAADLWNMPLAEKKETGNIYTGLTIIRKERSNDYNGFDTITLCVPDQGDDFLPNFRPGDMIYLYAYADGSEPDVRRAFLFKGTLVDIHTDRLVVHLSDGQQNAHVFESAALMGRKPIPYSYAVEHGNSDVAGTAALRSLHEFISAPQACRDLLLDRREPRADTSLTLSRSYMDTYDDIILRARQATDYFLLVGPPGTGKTSMALQFMVREGLTRADDMLLMAYTNRAVDEICDMLDTNGIDFVRIGSEYTCDQRFRSHLLSSIVEREPRLDAVRQRLLDAHVIVGTTSTIQSHSYLFALKQFALAIVDEAGQILEPNLVGLLSRVPKFILVGDYKQLPAVVQQDASMSVTDDPLLHAIGLADCRSSLFQRLVATESRHGRTAFVGILNHQGRMHPDIAEYPDTRFYPREQLRCVPLPHQVADNIHPAADKQGANMVADALLLQHRMVFIPSPDCRHPELSDKVNTAEADIVVRLLADLYRLYGPDRFDAARTAGVIVPYRNQIAMIRRGLEALQIPALTQVSIDTVERYQGSQRDVIIYSFTVQNPWQLDFLTATTFTDDDGRTIDRKLNVALTRARKQLIMTGNERVLRMNALFADLIDYVKVKKGYINRG